MFKSFVTMSVFTACLLASGAQAQDVKAIPDLKGIQEPVSPNTNG